MPGIAQLIAAPVAEQQRAQGFARPLALRVAAHDELRRAGCLDLAPGRRALSWLVNAVLTLGDDALEATVDCRSVQFLGVVRRMRELDVLREQQTLRQIPPPIDVRRSAQIETGEMQQVETHQHNRCVTLCAGDLRGRLQLGTILQRVERRPAIRGERDNLAIEDRLVYRSS